MANTLRAGRITGDPAAGLCERMCIEVKRVFDGCRESVSNQNFTLELNGIPPQAVPPLTFIRAESHGNAVFTLSDEENLANGKTCFSGEVSIPVIVTFADSLGNRYTATSNVRFFREFALGTPANSIVLYSLEVFVAFLSTIGNFISPAAVSVNACYVLIAKVIVPTDILVPTYGRCVYPDCTDCGENTCNAFLELPLFPD